MIFFWLILDFFLCACECVRVYELGLMLNPLYRLQLHGTVHCWSLTANWSAPRDEILEEQSARAFLFDEKERERAKLEVKRSEKWRSLMLSFHRCFFFSFFFCSPSWGNCEERSFVLIGPSESPSEWKKTKRTKQIFEAYLKLFFLF